MTLWAYMLAAGVGTAPATVTWETELCSCSAPLSRKSIEDKISAPLVGKAITFAQLREPVCENDPMPVWSQWPELKPEAVAALGAKVQAVHDACEAQLKAYNLPLGEIWEELRAELIADTRLDLGLNRGVLALLGSDKTAGLRQPINGHPIPKACLDEAGNLDKLMGAKLRAERLAMGWYNCVNRALRLNDGKTAQKALQTAKSMLAQEKCECDEP